MNQLIYAYCMADVEITYKAFKNAVLTSDANRELNKPNHRAFIKKHCK